MHDLYQHTLIQAGFNILATFFRIAEPQSLKNRSHNPARTDLVMRLQWLCMAVPSGLNNAASSRRSVTDGCGIETQSKDSNRSMHAVMTGLMTSKSWLAIYACTRCQMQPRHGAKSGSPFSCVLHT